MGIGYDTNEATQDVLGGSKYHNLIDELVSQGLISHQAYSLWLNDLASSTGSILFGGIDTEKYTGALKSIPLESDPESTSTDISTFTVALSGLTISSGTETLNSSTSLSIPVVLDSGTTLTYLPDEIFTQIADTAGAVKEDDGAIILIDCNATDKTFTYQFGGTSGPSIAVKISELIFPVSAADLAEQGITASFKNSCLFGIYPGGEGPYLLGDTFLRSAYVVYDLKNNEVALAQSSFGSTGSNVVEIDANASSIPLVSGSGVASSSPTAGTASSTATSSSTSAAATTIPAFDIGGCVVLVLSGLFSLLGGIWFVI